MKPLLITFFLVLLGYSFFFDEKKEKVDSLNFQSTTKCIDLVSNDQEEYGACYAKFLQVKPDSLEKNINMEDYFIKK